MYKWTKSNTYAQRLSGRDGEKIGLTRSISVMPGDKVNIEVYAKYYDPTASNEATFANLMSAIINNIGVPAGTFVDGAGYGLSTNLPFTPGWGAKDGTGAPPMAYLNWMVFDRDYSQDLGRSGYMRITTNAKETGTNATHDKLFSPEITITQPGYVYIWLSNENPTPVEVYFDDFKVTQVKSPVIQQDDYYPFGLTFNSYSRENSTQQNYLYNGKELQDELSLNWLDYGARMYDPSIARWMVSDPLAEKYSSLTNYAYVANNPVKLIDPNGKEIWIYYQEARTKKDGTVKTDKHGNVKYKTVGVQYKPGEKYEGKNQFVANSFAALDKAQTKGADGGVISDLANRKQKVGIVQGGSGLDNAPNNKGDTAWKTDGSRTIVWWDQYGAKIEEAGQTKGYQSPSMLLFHEAVHAQRELNGDFVMQGGRNGLMLNNSISIFKATSPTTGAQVKAEEEFVIRNYETPAAVTLGEYPRYDRDQASPQLMQSSTSNIPKNQ